VGKKKKIKQWEIVSTLFLLFDVISIAFSFLIALWLRFDCRFSSIPQNYFESYYKSIILHIAITILVYELFKLYNSVWKFAGYYEFVRLAIATVITGISNVLITNIVYFIHNSITGRMPISYYVFGTIFQFFFAIGIRFAYRTIQLLRNRNTTDLEYVKPVIIYGAGDSGRLLAKDIMQNHQLGERVVAFFDDDPEKKNRQIDGIKVVGGREDILKTVEELNIQRIYVAIPSAPKAELKEILNICKEAKCEVLNLPGIYQLRSGQVKVSQMKEVQIEDLLGRETIKVNNEEIGRFIEGKTVLITGAGGRWWDNRTNQGKALFYRGFESFDFGLN